MGIQFTPEIEAQFKALLPRYPNKLAALIPTLYLAQEQFGYLRPEVMEYVAQRLDLPASQVLNTATFYTMLHKKPVGRYHIEVCTNVSCYLRGCDDVLDALQKKLSIECGETTADGLFTLDEVQCLAACGTAPVMCINRIYRENLTPDSAVKIVEGLGNPAKG